MEKKNFFMRWLSCIVYDFPYVLYVLLGNGSSDNNNFTIIRITVGTVVLIFIVMIACPLIVVCLYAAKKRLSSANRDRNLRYICM